MSEKDNGGPAFPIDADCLPQMQGWCGMTMRDYFAAKAMQGLCSNHEWLENAATNNNGDALKALAASAYEAADAMLKARGN